MLLGGEQMSFISRVPSSSFILHTLANTCVLNGRQVIPLQAQMLDYINKYEYKHFTLKIQSLFNYLQNATHNRHIVVNQYFRWCWVLSWSVGITAVRWQRSCKYCNFSNIRFRCNAYSEVIQLDQSQYFLVWDILEIVVNNQLFINLVHIIYSTDYKMMM